MPLRFEYIYARLRASEPAWSKWVKGLVAIIRALWSVHDIALQIAQAALPPPEPPGGVDPDNSADESSDDSDASSHEGPPPDEPPDELVPPDSPDAPDGPDELPPPDGQNPPQSPIVPVSPAGGAAAGHPILNTQYIQMSSSSAKHSSQLKSTHALMQSCPTHDHTSACSDCGVQYHPTSHL